MTRITNMLRLPRNLGRRAIIIGSLAAAFLFALTVPIPTLPDAGRAEVRAQVADRLPGWSVQRIDPSWENAYAVVTSCAGRELAFQFVPGHGLPRHDAWIQPHNSYARARLGATPTTTATSSGAASAWIRPAWPAPITWRTTARATIDPGTD